MKLQSANLLAQLGTMTRKKMRKHDLALFGGKSEKRCGEDGIHFTFLYGLNKRDMLVNELHDFRYVPAIYNICEAKSCWL